MTQPSPNNRYYYYAADAHPPARAKPLPLLALSALIVIGAIVFSSVHMHNKSQERKALAAATLAKERIAQEQIAKSEQTMQSDIRTIIAQHLSMNISASVVTAQTGNGFSEGLDATYDAASIGKLITALTFLSEVDSGKRALTNTIDGTPAKTLLSAMITKSDNNAWSSLNKSITHNTLRAYTEAHGIQTYDPSTNTVRAHDIARLLYALYHGDLLAQPSRQLLLDYMAKANKTDYIVAAVPGSIPVYHKAGWLDDRAHDAAIINDKTNPYILVVFIKDPTATSTDGQRATIIGNITRATTAHFLERLPTIQKQ